MQLTASFLLAVCLQVSAIGVSQKVTFKGDNVALPKVFEAVKRQTGYLFVYSDEKLLVGKACKL